MPKLKQGLLEAELGCALDLSDFTLCWCPSRAPPTAFRIVHVPSMTSRPFLFRMGILIFTDKPQFPIEYISEYK